MADPSPPTSPDSTRPKRDLYTRLCARHWAIGGILVVALALRLVDLGESLWFDELWSTHLKLGSLSHLVRTVVYQPHPPFHSVFLFGWIKLFGDSELSIRLPSLLFGLAGIALTYAVCRRFIGTRAGLLAASLVAVSPAHIWYSQEARPYTAITTLVFASVYCYERAARDREGLRWLLAYAACMLAAVLTHYYAVAFIAVTSLLCLRRGDLRNLRLFSLNVLIGGLLLAFLLAKAGAGRLRTDINYLENPGFSQFWTLLFHWFPTGNALGHVGEKATALGLLMDRPWIPLVHGFLALLFCAGVVAIWRRVPDAGGSHPRLLLLYLACLPGLMLGLEVFGLSSTFIERSMLPMQPFYCGVLAAGLLSISGRSTRRVAAAGLATLSLVVLVGFHAKNERGERTVYRQNPDWRSAVAYLTGEIEASSARSLTLGNAPLEPLFYYDPRFCWVQALRKGVAGAQADAQEPSSLRERIHAAFRAEDEKSAVTPCFEVTTLQIFRRNWPRLPVDPPPEVVFLVLNRFWDTGADRLRYELWHRADFMEVDSFEGRGIQVLKFEVSRPSRARPR